MDGAGAELIPEHVARDRVFDFDIYTDPRVNEDVQGTSAEAIRTAPDVFYTTRNGGHWIARSPEAISEIVKDYEYFSVREMQIPRVPNPPFFIPLSLDPPVNLPYRAAMMPAFSPKAIRELEPKARAWAVKIIEDVADKGECDFIRDVSALFPVSVFMELMGIPVERLRECRECAEQFFNAHEGADMEAAGAKIMGLLGELLELRRAEPAADLMTHFLNVEIEGRKLNPDEVMAMSFVLFLGGMDTVTNMIGFSFQHLSGDPKLQARLAAEPTLIPKFVEECLRCFAIINTPRLVVKDCERFGVSFKAGEMVLNMTSVVGRDPRMNDDPSRFNIDREHVAHLTFSQGPHLCIGHVLARAEMRILTEEWFKRVPSFTAKPGVKHGFRMGTVHALESLPLEWGTAA